MTPSIGRLFRGDFARHGLLLFSASMLVNACNYAFHFVASRRLGPSGYGDLYALITALGLLGVVSASVTTVIVRLTAELSANDDPGVIASLLRLTRRWSLTAAAALGVAALLLRAPIAGFLNIAQPDTVIPWVVVLAGSIVVPPLRAVLQGVQDFRSLAISTATEALGKVALGATGVLLGFGTTGALAGQALGMLLAWGYTEARLRGHLMGVEALPLSLSRSRLVAVTLGAVGSTLATTALLSVDALLAKHYLGPGEAGVYSAVSLAGKVLMFAVGFVPMILLPKATHAAMRGEPVLPFLIGGSAMSLALTAVALGAYALIPGTVVHVMVGSAYDAAAPLLLPYGFAMALLATTNIVVAYKIAVHRFEFVVPLLICAGAEAVGIALHHDSIAQIVTVLIGAQALGLLISLLPWNVRRAAPYPAPPAEATGGVA